jgi:hypothetical protein
VLSRYGENVDIKNIKEMFLNRFYIITLPLLPLVNSISPIYQDFFAYPKYDIQFESGNITSLGSIEISSPITTCYIPKTELTEELEIDEPDLEKSLQKLSQMPCLYQIRILK